LAESATSDSADSDGAVTVDEMQELIGATPLLRLPQTGAEDSEIYLKMESANPSGSIRDRYLAEIVKRAVDAGQLVPGETVAVAGLDDCAVSAAFLAMQLGVCLKVFAAEDTSRRLLPLIERFDAEIEWLDAGATWNDAVNRAAGWARQSPDRMFVNGYRREAVRDSYAEVADEILEALDGTPVGAFITSVTTGGAYRQVTGELREHHPEMLVGGAVLSEAEFPTLVEDNQNVLRDISMDRAWEMRDQLARREGVLVGPKGAAAVALGVELQERLDPGTAVVALNPDAGQRYLGWEDEPLVDTDRG